MQDEEDWYAACSVRPMKMTQLSFNQDIVILTVFTIMVKAKRPIVPLQINVLP